MRPQFGLFALLTISVNLGFSTLPYPALIREGDRNFQVLAQTSEVLKARANQLLQLGVRQHRTGQFQAALESLQQSLSLYRDINDAVGQANSLSGLGNTYFSLGQYWEATEYYYQQLGIVRDIGDRSAEVKTLLDMSNAYFYLGQEDLAKEFQRQAMVVKREIGNPPGEAAFYGDVGINYDSQKQYPQAVDFYQQQLVRVRKNGDRYGEAYALNQSGQVYESQGKYQQAIELYQQQQDISRKVGDGSGEIDALNRIAGVYESQNQSKQAIEVYQQALAIASSKRDPNAEANAKNALAAAYRRQGQYPQAIELYQQLLSVAKDKGDRLQEGTALNNLGLTSFKAGNVADAQQKLLSAIQVWEAIRTKLNSKDNYFQEQANTYSLLQQVLVAQNQPQAALEIAEQGRWKGFMQLLGMRLFSESAGTNLTPLPREITIPNIQQIQQIAREQNATIVDYSIVSDDGIYVWVIQPAGAIAFRKIDLKSQNKTSIEDVVASFRKSLAGSGKSSVEAEAIDRVTLIKPLKELHQLLIEPIEEQLPKDPNARVIFIPQKELFLVPFAALVDVSGKYLIEKHTISTAPAIEVLKLSRRVRREVRGDKALIIGNPNMPNIPPGIGQPGQPLPPLVGAEQESLEIAQLLKTKAIIGSQATKGAIAPQFAEARIIHFATYGILDELATGIPGAIALAPSGSDNGLLTAKDILSLPAKPDEFPLHAELVTISAGKTGEGRITGNGAIGLSGSLIAAGVPSIIVSLWSVPDAPVTGLMTEFYRNFQRDRNKATALRKAMLSTMKQHPNPRDWAAFTLIGEAN